MQNQSRDSDRGTSLVPLRAAIGPGSGVVNLKPIPVERRQATVRTGRWACVARRGHPLSPIGQNGRDSAADVTRYLRNARPDRGSDWGQCGLFAVDIAGFTGPLRDNDIQMYLHKSLYEMLQIAFDMSDVPWADCSHEDRGDGVLVVAPPNVSASTLVPIPDRLRWLIRRHNHVSCEAAYIQLRSALHLGPVHHDGHGFIGADVNLLCRLLDTRQLKRRLADSTTEIGLIASDYLYFNVIRRQPSFVDPALFDPVRIRVKEARARAWVYLPGE
jgi:hypothetical protein